MPEQCAAITKSGKQCKRKALEGSLYCAQHANYAAVKIDVPAAPSPAETKNSAAEEKEAIQEALGQIKARVEEIKSDSEKFSPANFSPEKLYTWIKENISSFNLPVINEVSAKLQNASAEDFRNPETWKEIWVIVSASIQEEVSQAMSKAEEMAAPAINKVQEQLDGLPSIGEAKEQIAENPNVKSAKEFVEKIPGVKEGVDLINQVPGAATLNKLGSAIDGTAPKDFLDTKTWEGFWKVVNHSLSDEIQKLRGKPVEEEIIEVKES